MAGILLATTQPFSGSTGAHELSACLPLQAGHCICPAKMKDEGIQSALERALDKYRSWHSLIEVKKMAVGVVDLSDPADVSFARVNGRTMMYAASLPKIAVLLAAYQCFEDSVLEENPKIHKDLVQMIRRSDNRAATRVIDRVGLNRIEAILQDPRYRFYDGEEGGAIWIGARYAQGGERNPEPVKGMSLPRLLIKYAVSTICWQTVKSSARNARARCLRFFPNPAFTINL